VAHAAQRDLEGKNLTGYQDVRGKYPCREAAELSRKQGGGFLEFHRNDSCHFLQQTGDLIMTGPTGTNVMDMTALLIS